MLLLGGLVGTIPSATDERVRGEWAFGPEALAGVLKKWGVAGLLLNASWDVSGDDKGRRVAGQYFYALSLPRAMQFFASPPFVYDLDSEEFTLPVGGGISKTVITGAGMPWKFSAQLWYYASQPDAVGPEWQLRVSISPVLKLPWGS